jgi:hypothetical protein
LLYNNAIAETEAETEEEEEEEALSSISFIFIAPRFLSDHTFKKATPKTNE